MPGRGDPLHRGASQDKVVVVKYGGNALAGADEASGAGSASPRTSCSCGRSGCGRSWSTAAGPRSATLMARLGKEPEFRDGLRVTDAETLDIVRMVLVGKVNRDIVGAPSTSTVRWRSACPARTPGSSRRAARPASGSSATSPRSTRRPRSACSAEAHPRRRDDRRRRAGQAYNINADTVAGAVAEALGAEKLIYLTDVDGLRRDVDDPASVSPARAPASSSA